MQTSDAQITLVGRRAVLEALTAPEVDVELVRVARGAPAALRKEVEASCHDRSVKCEIGSAAKLRTLSRDARHDHGVAARVTLRGVREMTDVVRDAPAAAHWLALDGITNPSNAGMIARSAAASGIDGILWPRVGTPWLNGLVVKASAGAVLRCPIARCDSLAEGLDALRGAGFQAIGLCAHAGDDLYTAAIPERAVYVVGSETEGLSEATQQRLDARVHVTLSDRAESLNAAVAAALVCFHVSNSRR